MSQSREVGKVYMWLIRATAALGFILVLMLSVVPAQAQDQDYPVATFTGELNVTSLFNGAAVRFLSEHKGKTVFISSALDFAYSRETHQDFIEKFWTYDDFHAAASGQISGRLLPLLTEKQGGVVRTYVIFDLLSDREINVSTHSMGLISSTIEGLFNVDMETDASGAVVYRLTELQSIVGEGLANQT